MGAPGLFLERQGHFLCIAAMMKDFWLPDDLSASYVLHHLLGAAGCGMCLVLPAGYGAATLNAAQAECSSILFNLMHVLPVIMGDCKGSRSVRIFLQYGYLCGMMVSHIVAFSIGVLYAFHLA